MRGASLVVDDQESIRTFAERTLRDAGYEVALVSDGPEALRVVDVQAVPFDLFVIGGGRAGLYLVAGLPMLTWCATFGLALTTGGIKDDFIVAVVLAATTYPAYALCRRLWGGPPRGQSVFDPLANPAKAP